MNSINSPLSPSKTKLEDSNSSLMKGRSLKTAIQTIVSNKTMSSNRSPKT